MDAKNLERTDSFKVEKQILNKVPQITFYFWIIKILCTTVGETAADFLNTNLNLGLTATSLGRVEGGFEPPASV